MTNPIQPNVHGFFLDLVNGIGEEPFTPERFLAQFPISELIVGAGDRERVDILLLTKLPASTASLLTSYELMTGLLETAYRAKDVLAVEIISRFGRSAIIEKFALDRLWSYFADRSLLTATDANSLKHARRGLSLLLKKGVEHHLLTQREVMTGPVAHYLMNHAPSERLASIGKSALELFAKAQPYIPEDLFATVVPVEEVSPDVLFEHVIVPLIGERHILATQPLAEKNPLAGSSEHDVEAAIGAAPRLATDATEPVGTPTRRLGTLTLEGAENEGLADPKAARASNSTN